jgi:hypothetical protein
MLTVIPKRLENLTDGLNGEPGPADKRGLLTDRHKDHDDDYGCMQIRRLVSGLSSNMRDTRALHCCKS